MPPQLQLRDIKLALNETPLLDGAEFSIVPGDRIALVGRNGSGKSTLLRIAAGLSSPDSGERFVQPGASMRYLAQEPDLTGFATTLDFVVAGLDDSSDAYRARALMSDLKVREAADPAQLSGGEARRAALARVLAAEPDILLLDEPTNHLDLVAIEWLEDVLQNTRSALAIISHDRRLLADVTRTTIWLDRGVTRRLDRGFAAFEEWRDQKLEEEEAERHKQDRKIVSEEHWIRYGVTARRKRNMRRVSELAAMRSDRREARRATGLVVMSTQDAKSSGALVVEAERISKSFQGPPIIHNFSMRVMRGDRVGFVGANGAGKSTLLNLLTGQSTPDSGQIRRGSQIAMATLDQRRATLAPTTTLVDALTGGGSDYVQVNGEKRHVIGYMKDFLFAPEQARTPIGKLSGGERGRLMLARALTTPSNLLVLDEPTNDLDIETLDLLQELLCEFPGTLLLVSHDRDFMDRVVTSVIVSEGAGRWVEYAGGYSDMVSQRGYGLSGPVVAPPAKSGQATRREPKRVAVKRKLSFMEKHALEMLPSRIEALNTKVAELEAKLADGELHSRDKNSFRLATEQHSELKRQIEAMEEDWLKLEILREDLQGPNS